MKASIRADLALAAALAALGCAASVAGVELVRRTTERGGWQQSMVFEDALGLLAAGTGILVLGWWFASLLAALLSAALQRAGRLRAAAWTSRLSPAFMRRLAAGALGVQLASANVLGLALTAGTQLPAGEPPLNPAFSLSAPGPSTDAPLPAIGSPSVDPRWVPQAPLPSPEPVVAAPSRTTPAEAAPSDVVVRSGDSLWTIAAARLGTLATDVEISQEWPRWFLANRSTIGPDPDVLRPGQVLHAP